MEQRSKNKLKCQKGQGLVEYLIIVAMMGIASLGVIRFLNQTVNAQFGNVVYKLQGSGKRAQKDTLDENTFKKKDMSSFLNGSASKDN